jgi:hypothetical protein
MPTRKLSLFVASYVGEKQIAKLCLGLMPLSLLRLAIVEAMV